MIKDKKVLIITPSSQHIIGFRAGLIKALKSCIAEYNINDILFVGGVASNSLIRSRLSEMLHANIIYASAELSTDNAVGTAYLGYLNHGSLSDMQ